MRVTHEQIPNTIKFLQIDFPALVLQTAGIEESDEYWAQVIEQTHIVSEKYQKNGFVDHMLLSYIDYLEKMHNKSKELRKGRDRNDIWHSKEVLRGYSDKEGYISVHRKILERT